MPRCKGRQEQNLRGINNQEAAEDSEGGGDRERQARRHAPGVLSKLETDVDGNEKSEVISYQKSHFIVFIDSDRFKKPNQTTFYR